ncbi:MAG: hypothetical protein AAF541_06885 [Pseudomonadota bacterium]
MKPTLLQEKREAAFKPFNEKRKASQRAHAERKNPANIDPQYANLPEHLPDPAYVPPPWYAPKKENNWNPATPKTKECRFWAPV